MADPEPQYNINRTDLFFKNLEEEIAKLDPRDTFAHGELVYERDFKQRQGSGKGYDIQNTFYCDTSGSQQELGVTFFGEVCGKDLGTRITAVGNHFIGPQKQPITDKSRVRDVIALRSLGHGTKYLNDAFNNQLETLTNIMEVERKKYFVDKPDRKYKFSEFLLPSGGEGRKIIKFTFKDKYEIPSAAMKSAIDEEPPAKKRKMQDPSSSQVGDYYSPTNLKDYIEGDCFQLKEAMLVQQDIVDVENNFIAPWEMHDKLRPGTIVLIEATLMRSLIVASKTDRRIAYQLRAHRMRVVDHSDEPQENLEVTRIATPQSSPRKVASQSFSAFIPPRKYMKSI